MIEFLAFCRPTLGGGSQNQLGLFGFQALLKESTAIGGGLWDSHKRDALARIGDSAIDWIFDATSKAMQQPLYDGAVAYFSRRKASDPSYDDSGVDAGLIREMMDCVKRDIAWSAVEVALRRPGFFSALLSHYRKGRWPCSWAGEYPDGCVVAL